MLSPRCIVADPPWAFSDALPGDTRGAASQYACLPVDDIARVMLPAFVGHDNLVLFLWRVAAMQPEALELCRLLEVTVKSEIVWEKLTSTGAPHFGMGHYVRNSHETCLIATRGEALPAVRNVRSRFAAPVRAHSQKPDAFYHLVRAMYPRSRKVEFFARTKRFGWTQLGNQLGSIPQGNQLPQENGTT